MVQLLLPGAIPSSISGISHLPFVGPVSPNQSFAIPPDAQLGGCEIAIPACPVNNPSKTSAFPLSTSTSFSSFSPIGSASTRAQPEKGFQEPQNLQLPSTLPWPFPPGLSLPAPSQSQNAAEHQIQSQFPLTQSPTLPSLPRPRLIRSHSVMGNHCPLLGLRNLTFIIPRHCCPPSQRVGRVFSALNCWSFASSAPNAGMLYIKIEIQLLELARVFVR